MIIIGLILIPFVIMIILGLKSIKVKKKTKFILNCILILMAVIYVVLTIIINSEPLQFTILNVSDYFTFTALIFLFSPVLWIILIYYFSKITRKFRVHKNTKIKSKEDFIYYRDNLNEISPSILMFTSNLDTDINKCIASVILKLKINKYLITEKDKLIYTNKDSSNLLETEKIILDYVQTGKFDQRLYEKLVEKEALESKYVKKNAKGKFIRIIKILITIIIPIILFTASYNIDQYNFEYYEVMYLNNERYLKIKDEKEIENLYSNEIKNLSDYYHSKGNDQQKYFYSYNLIRTDKLEYSIVRKKLFFEIITGLSIILTITSAVVAAFKVIQQIIYFNKKYIRTTKGNELLTKAYALKNYLKEFSLIKDKKEEDLILWEYYLVYAVILDINVKIEDTMIDKYFTCI